VYVAFPPAPGAVDVIDTTLTRESKEHPGEGGRAQYFMTPDGRYVVAGSIAGKVLTVIDSQTKEAGVVPRI